MGSITSILSVAQETPTFSIIDYNGDHIIEEQDLATILAEYRFPYKFVDNKNIEHVEEKEVSIKKREYNVEDFYCVFGVEAN
jgi:hypothetical protein